MTKLGIDPVGTAEEFLGFLQALAASGPTVPKPTAIEAFLGTRPRALAFATTPKPAPVSFVTESYFGVHAFRFITGKMQVNLLAIKFTLSRVQRTSATPKRPGGR